MISKLGQCSACHCRCAWPSIGTRYALPASPPRAGASTSAARLGAHSRAVPPPPSMAPLMRLGLMPADSKASIPQQPGRGGCCDGPQWGGALVCGFVCLCWSCLSEPRMPGLCFRSRTTLLSLSSTARHFRLRRGTVISSILTDLIFSKNTEEEQLHRNSSSRQQSC